MLFWLKKMKLNELTSCSVFLTNIKDGDPNEPTENSTAAAIGPRCKKAGPLLWVRRCCPLLAHVHLCTHCPLARLHMVRHRLCGEAVHWDRLAGQPGRTAGQVIQRQWLYIRPISQGQIRHRPLFHTEQFDECRVRQRLSQHQLGKDLLHLCHGHWLWVE